MSEWIQPPELAAFMARQRWFGEGAHEVAVTEVHQMEWLSDPADGLGVRFELVTAGSLYNVPLSYRREPREDLSHGLVGASTLGDEVFYVYDALYDPQARAIVLRGFDDGVGCPPDIQYSRLEHGSLELEEESLMLSVEQSNTSVIAGDVLIKFFRKLAHGRNPDIEIQAALTQLGSEEISPLVGWISTGDIDLAMAGYFQRSATDGWDSARASVRALQADEVRARDAGGDFAGECERLGATLAAVHAQMRTALPITTWGPSDVTALIDRLNQRLDRTLAKHDTVRVFADRVRVAYAGIDESAPIPVQRVHGDFHLGQTLRTTTGWKIIDFEGEPAQPLEDRVRLDCVVRDLAGMLRSLDYAAHSVTMTSGVADNEYVDDWVRRNRAAFLHGYGCESSPALLRAYEIDKALYEVVYELNYRPEWVHIPMQALHRLL